MKAGRFEDALAFLEQARPADEDEAIERRFLLGAVYMRLGRPREAAEQYEAILAIRPDLTRVRLELARAHYAAGQDDKAKYHFQLSLGGEVAVVGRERRRGVSQRDRRTQALVGLCVVGRAPREQRRAPYRQGNRADRGRDVPAERGRARGVRRRRAAIGRRRVLSDRRHRPARAPGALHSSQALRASRRGTISRLSARPGSRGSSMAEAFRAGYRPAAAGRARRGSSTASAPGRALAPACPAACTSVRARTWTTARTMRETSWTGGVSP